MVYAPSGSVPSAQSGLGGGGGRWAGWRQGRGEPWRARAQGLRGRTWVIYSESDGNDLMVQNELSLGAPRKNHMIHFYSSTFYTNSFVGREKCLI